MKEIENRWQEIKETISKECDISTIAYDTWIKPLEYVKMKDHKVYISFPSDKTESIKYLNRKYKEFFDYTISEIMNDFYQVEFILKSQVEVEEKETSYNNVSLYKQANLIEKYTFDNFIVGSNNNFAHSASVAVAESPGEDFNPLFIYGGSGLGKTHLIHAIGHYIIDHNPDKKVLYVKSETFTNDVIESIRSGNSSSMNKLRDKYRNVDVLLIDDIQFIIGKESTQEEFFHTFNALYEAGKTIVITSDKPPKQMETLDERFRSRFQMGLQADIQPPNYETRVAILLKLAENYHNEIGNDVIEYIADNIKSNIRELEGAFNIILAFSKINSHPITIELAEEALKDMIYPDKPKIITPTIVIQVVAEHYNIKPQDITSNKKNAEIVLPRQISMYLIRELTDLPLKNIAIALNILDHTTVKHGVEKNEKLMITNPEVVSSIETIKKKIMPN